MEEKLELLGRVLLEAGKKFSVQWLPGEKKPLDQGDILLLKFREIEILTMEIGSLKEISNPMTMTWISKTMVPSDDEPFVCKVYRKRRSP